MTASANGTARRRVLMLCYLYPPVAGPAMPAVKRAVRFVSGLNGSDWEPVVVTLDPTLYEPYLPQAPDGVDEVRTDVRVERTGRVMMFRRLFRAALAVRAALRRVRRACAPGTTGSGPSRSSRTAGGTLKTSLESLVQIPDQHLGWLPHAYLRAMSVIASDDIDCIYATGFPWSTLVVGALLKRSTDVPLVLDFRDPWVTNPYRAHFPAWRQRIEARLERFTVMAADAVIANTGALRDEFRRRYDGPRAPRFEAVYNSVDVEVSRPRAAAPQRLPVRLVHAGFLYGPRDPRTFLQALARHRRRHPDGAEPDVLVDFVGTEDLPYSVDQLLAELGLSDVVTRHGGLSHAASLEFLSKASAFLVLQPGTRTQLPSKLFEYVGFGKPILTIAEPGGETDRFAREELHAITAPTGDEDAIADALDRLVDDVRAGRGPDPALKREVAARYGRHVTTQRFVHILESVMRSGAAPGWSLRRAHGAVGRRP